MVSMLTIKFLGGLKKPENPEEIQADLRTMCNAHQYNYEKTVGVTCINFSTLYFGSKMTTVWGLEAGQQCFLAFLFRAVYYTSLSTGIVSNLYQTHIHLAKQSDKWI